MCWSFSRWLASIWTSKVYDGGSRSSQPWTVCSPDVLSRDLPALCRDWGTPPDWPSWTTRLHPQGDDCPYSSRTACCWFTDDAHGGDWMCLCQKQQSQPWRLFTKPMGLGTFAWRSLQFDSWTLWRWTWCASRNSFWWTSICAAAQHTSSSQGVFCTCWLQQPGSIGIDETLNTMPWTLLSWWFALLLQKQEMVWSCQDDWQRRTLQPLADPWRHSHCCRWGECPTCSGWRSACQANHWAATFQKAQKADHSGFWPWFALLWWLERSGRWSRTWWWRWLWIRSWILLPLGPWWWWWTSSWTFLWPTSTSWFSACPTWAFAWWCQRVLTWYSCCWGGHNHATWGLAWWTFSRWYFPTASWTWGCAIWVAWTCDWAAWTCSYASTVASSNSWHQHWSSCSALWWLWWTDAGSSVTRSTSTTRSWNTWPLAHSFWDWAWPGDGSRHSCCQHTCSKHTSWADRDSTTRGHEKICQRSWRTSQTQPLQVTSKSDVFHSEWEAETTRLHLAWIHGTTCAQEEHPTKAWKGAQLQPCCWWSQGPNWRSPHQGVEQLAWIWCLRSDPSWESSTVFAKESWSSSCSNAMGWYQQSSPRRSWTPQVTTCCTWRPWT